MIMPAAFLQGDIFFFSLRKRFCSCRRI
jgi:hypothetical protein